MKKIILLIVFLSIHKSYSQEYNTSSPKFKENSVQNYSVKDYIEFARIDSIGILKNKNKIIKEITDQTNVEINNYNKNVNLFNERKTAEAINRLKSYNEIAVSKINEEADKQILEVAKNRDEWVKYLKPIEDQKIAKEEASKKMQEEKEKKQFPEKYKIWKTKYFASLKSANTNVNACEAIIKKHTYLNRFREKRYDSDTFTKQEKITFNKNLDALEDKLKSIWELEKEDGFYNYYDYWQKSIPFKESLESVRLGGYLNNTSRCY